MIITAVHAVLILGLAIQGALAGCVRRQKEPEHVTIVDIRSMPLPAAETPVPDQPESLDPVVPEPPPPEPTPIPEKPKPPKKKEIEVNKKRVRRKPEPTPRNVTPRVSQKEIERLLRDGMSSSNLPRTSDFPFPLYIAHVKATLYKAWNQPSGSASVPSGAVVSVSITVERSGRISAHAVVSASGYAQMDASVRAAVRSVPRLDPLPTRYAGDSWRTIVDFELAGTAL